MFLVHVLWHYPYVVVEFADLLGAGYWSPQWATHVRGGLGTPYFSYYQPGFFYVASLFAGALDAARAVGGAVFLGALAGYASMLGLVGSRFGRLAGFLAANAFLLSPFVASEVFIRGDLSEFMAMMLVPFVLHRFLDALEECRGQSLVGLAVGFGLLAPMHPVVGLLTAIVLAGAVAAFSAVRRDWRRSASVGLALGVGAGLSAFYALPVLFEMHHVASERAFVGFFHYSSHFVLLRDLLGPYSRATVVPFTIGPVQEGLLGLALVSLVIGWRRVSGPQRRFLALVWGVAVGSAFLMHPAAAPIWAHAPLLYKLQFPWRALSLVTPALAAAGSALIWRGRPGWRLLAVAAVIAALLGLSREYTKPIATLPYARVATAAEIETVEFFRPDVVDEWLPRGAPSFSAADAPRVPAVNGPCEVSDFRRGQGRLEVRVGPTAGCEVVLPHYFFPVGWTARFRGDAISLGRDPRGLMSVRIPPGEGGRLTVRFRMTPMRRVGWAITAAGLGGLFLLARIGQRAAPPSPS